MHILPHGPMTQGDGSRVSRRRWGESRLTPTREVRGQMRLIRRRARFPRPTGRGRNGGKNRWWMTPSQWQQRPPGVAGDAAATDPFHEDRALGPPASTRAMDAIQVCYPKLPQVCPHRPHRHSGRRGAPHVDERLVDSFCPAGRGARVAQRVGDTSAKQG